MGLYYIMNVERRAVDVSIEFNGVPIVQWTGPGPQQVVEALNGWMIGTAQELRVRLEWPRRKRFAAGQAKFLVRVAGLERDKPPSAKGALCEFDWPIEGQAEQYPYETVLRFDVGKPPPAELWTHARPMDFNDGGRAAVLDAVRQVHEAFGARDRARCAALLEYKALDVRRAFHIPPEEGRRDLAELLDELFSTPDWAVAPLEPEKLELHVVAGNRVVWATMPGNVAAIRTAASSSAGFSLPLYLAPLEGKWTVVR